MSFIPSDILAHLILTGNVTGRKEGAAATGDAEGSAFADALATLLGNKPQTDGFAFLTDAEQQSVPLSVESTEVSDSEDNTNVPISVAALEGKAPEALPTVPADLVAAHRLATVHTEDNSEATLPTKVVATDQDADQAGLPQKATVHLKDGLTPQIQKQVGETAPEPTAGDATKVAPTTAQKSANGQDALIIDNAPAVPTEQTEVPKELPGSKQENTTTNSKPIDAKSAHQNANSHTAEGATPTDVDDAVELAQRQSTTSAKGQAQGAVQFEQQPAETIKQSIENPPQPATEPDTASVRAKQDSEVRAEGGQRDTHRAKAPDVHSVHKDPLQNDAPPAGQSEATDQKPQIPSPDVTSASQHAEVEVSAAAPKANNQPEKLIKSESRSKRTAAEPIRHHSELQSEPRPTSATGATSSDTAPANELNPAAQMKAAVKQNMGEAQIVQSANQQTPGGAENSNQNQATTIQSLANAGQSTEKPAMPELTQPRQFIVETPKPIQVPGQVRVRIEPPELGHIRVDLTSSGNGIIGTMRIRSEQTRDMIERNIGDLHKSLADAGVRVERLEVVGTSRGDARQPFNPNTPNQNDGGNPWLRNQSHDQSGSPRQHHDHNDAQPSGGYHAPTAFANTDMDTASRVALGRLDLVA
ncbi:MAG: hypothetical protein GF341_00240 [candidate division Zixibacteria bacterium]|nr:hypothetical protein [candidate division Zixibacteria bacterium]